MANSSAKRDSPEASKDEDRGPRDQTPPTLVFAGFARLPQGAGVPSGGGVVTLEVEVDPYDMRIVDAACDCLPALGRKLLVSLLVRGKLEDGLTGVISDVRSRYSSITQRATITALEDMLRRCAEHGIVGRRSTKAPDRNPKG